MSIIKDKMTQARALVALSMCREIYARDDSGNPVMPKDKKAVCYCSVGAYIAVTDDLALRKQIHNALQGAAVGKPNIIATYHDSLPNTEAVLAWWDRAISSLE